MADGPSRIEGTRGVRDASRVASQRLEMMAERLDSQADRSVTEAKTAMDGLRKEVDDNLRAAASKAAGSAPTDRTAAAADPTTLPSNGAPGGKAAGVLQQLDQVLQQAATQLQQMEQVTQQLAASLLANNLGNPSGGGSPFGAASNAPVQTAGDNGGNAGGGFMPGNQPWLQTPEAFSTRSMLPDVASKHGADGSLGQFGEGNPAEGRERAEAARGQFAGLGALRPGAVAAATDTARQLMKDFGLTRQQAAGVAGGLVSGAVGGRARATEGSRRSAGSERRARWGGPRQQEFIDFALGGGLDPEVPPTALAFVAHEFGRDDDGALQALRNAVTAEEAAAVFQHELEREFGPVDEERQRAVRAIDAALRE